MHHYWPFGALVLAALLAGGCSSSQTKAPATPLKQSGSSKPKAHSPAEPTTDQLAKAHAHYAAGIICDMQDDSEGALREYSDAARLDPDNEALVLEVSRRLLQNKQPEKALEILLAASARPGASGAVFARLGLVYLQLGKYDLSVSANRTAIKRSPTLLTGYQNLFLTCLQNRQTEDALKALDDAARQPNTDAEFLLGLSELYGTYLSQAPAQRDRIKSKALDLLDRVAKLNPESAAYRVRLAEGFTAFGDSSKAANIYLELLKTLPDMPLLRERVHARLAGIFLRESDRKRAMEQMQALVKDDPTNPQVYYWLGYLAYTDKKPADAAEYLSKSILLKPDFEDAYYDLALAQLAEDKPVEALATLDKARKQFAKNFVLELYTGLAYSRQKAYRDATQHFLEAEVIANATEPSRLTPEFYFQIGAAYERVSDYAQAEKYFEKCLQLKPDFPEAQNYLGYMWAERGLKLEKARDLIEKAVKAEPKNAAFLDSFGWVLFKLQQPQKALSYILKAVELSEDPDATLFDHLGDIYAALHQPDKAREAWAKSLSVEANDEVRKKLESERQAKPQTVSP
jgi:tetratricopeptide (TPR) repeat protein